MRLLLKNNADVTIANQSGQTALLFAASDGQLECLRLMIDAKADVNQDKTGLTGLYSACQEGGT
jgi:ankyrin repeat protein